MEKESPEIPHIWRLSRQRAFTLILLALVLLGLRLANRISVLNAEHSLILDRCRALDAKPSSLAQLHAREHSDRFEPGTKPVLLRNARLWTGARNGTEVIHGSLFLDQGIIQTVGGVDLHRLPPDTVVLDANHSWVTAGLVDLHSNAAGFPLPALEGARDLNSPNGPVLPWLRTWDALNTHDDAYALSIAGGVTSALIHPGSANVIGGQAFAIKLRKTTARTPTSMLLEKPLTANASLLHNATSLRWRHMKLTCGEIPSVSYNLTRMDISWFLREAYHKAREIKLAQDIYCSKALRNLWDELDYTSFPEDIQWEALVDVLRGRVKIHAECHEIVDLDSLVQLSNEFEFPIAAIHSSEAYLASNTLMRSYGGDPPAVALSAQSARYRREAYRASEFAPRIVTDSGLRAVMKSDHPSRNSRYLLHEAQLAQYFGLDQGRALSAVTSYPAEVMGLGWRIGYIKEGYDADLVVWDSHPLALGATPSQVFIDGIPQLESPHMVFKPPSFQKPPRVPNFDKEARRAIQYEGLPPLQPSTGKGDLVAFENVRAVWAKTEDGPVQLFVAQNGVGLATVLTRNGSISCVGGTQSCVTGIANSTNIKFVDLSGGEIFPALISFGSQLGLSNIQSEESTNDGFVRDPLGGFVSKVLEKNSGIVKAVDGLEFGTRDALLAYRDGVTTAITAPTHRGLFSGLSTYFSTGAARRLEAQSVWQKVTALHVSLQRRENGPGVSTQITTLRHLLLGGGSEDVKEWWEKAAKGQIPLIVEAHSADVIGTLLLLKREIEAQQYQRMKLTVTGASEAHLLATELAEADVGVIVNPVRPLPSTWEKRRILPGPPITVESATLKLLSHNVTVGIGVEDIWSARNTRLDIAWISIEAGGRITKEQALALGSTNLERLLTGYVRIEGVEMVAIQGGGLLDMNSRVVAVISSKKGLVDLF